MVCARATCGEDSDDEQKVKQNRVSAVVQKHKLKQDKLAERLTKQKQSTKEAKVKLADKNSELTGVNSAFKV